MQMNIADIQTGKDGQKMAIRRSRRRGEVASRQGEKDGGFGKEKDGIKSGGGSIEGSVSGKVTPRKG